MPKNDRTARLLRVAHLLQQHPEGLTAKQIAGLCGVGVRTTFRDLRVLDERIGVAVWQDGGRWGIDKDSFLPPLRLSLIEATTLFLSSRLAHRYTDERNRALKEAWGKLAIILPEPIGRHVQATVSAMAARPLSAAYYRTLETLVVAWAEGRRVRIHYPVAGTAEVRDRMIEPYALEPAGASRSLYVIARDVALGMMRTFKLERIRQAALTDQGFAVPTDFDTDAYLQGSWSIWGEDAPVEVRVRFSPAVAGVVAETRWHPSQQLTPQSDGSLIWSARVIGTVEITPWIRSWGPDAEALGPLELRKQIAQEGRRLASMYFQSHAP